MEDLTRTINDHIRRDGHKAMSVEHVAMGFIRVANETMVRPIREISVMRGFDIKEHVLATFGGAGAQHTCAIAPALGISTIFIHRDGRKLYLGAKNEILAGPGDRFRILTPGGGGFGKKEK